MINKSKPSSTTAYKLLPWSDLDLVSFCILRMVHKHVVYAAYHYKEKLTSCAYLYGIVQEQNMNMKHVLWLQSVSVRHIPKKY